MRLYELTTLTETLSTKLLRRFRDDPSVNKSNFREKLDILFKQTGWKKFGSGANAGVWSNPTVNNYVYKCFHKDDAYIQWYKFCKKNQNNPFVPKFWNREDAFPLRDDGYWAVRIEKLDMAGDSHYRIIAPFVALIYDFDNVTKYRYDFKYLLTMAYFDNNVPQVDDYEQYDPVELQLFFTEKLNEVKRWFTKEELQQLMEIVTFLRQIRNKYPIDIHQHNIMMRGSQIVITDPIIGQDL